MNLFTRALKRIIDTLLAFGLLVIVVDLAVNVFMRYVLMKPIFWAEELAVVGLVFISYLGGAELVRKDKHVAITALFDLLRPKAAKRVKIVADVLSLFVMVVMIALYWKLIGKMSIGVTTQLGINESWFAVIAFVGFLLMAVYQIQNIVQAWRGIRRAP